MAAIGLNEAGVRADFFRQTVLANLEYWQGWLEPNLDDVPTLEREYQSLVRAITFGLELGEAAWPVSYAMITSLSPFMERRGHWKVWNETLRRAIEVAGEVDNAASIVTLSALLARLLFQQSHFRESVSYYRRVIRLARQIDDPFNEARACTNLGYHYVESGYWYRAEVLCCHALELFEEADSDHGRAHTENHLGILYIRQHRWNLALKHLDRALIIWQAMGNEHDVMRAYINLGMTYIGIENPALALKYLHKAFDLAQSSGDKFAGALAYMNMGLAYVIEGKFTIAENRTRQAVATFEELQHPVGLAQAWNVLGVIYTHQGVEKEAVYYFNRSLKAWRNLNNRVEEIEVLLDMAELDLAQGKHNDLRNRLSGIRTLLNESQSGPLQHRFQKRLEKYHRSLQGTMPHQAAAKTAAS